MTSTIEKAEKGWLVYIIETDKGHLYTGITNDLQRRVAQHKSGRGAKYFRSNAPKQVVWYEENHTKASASQREALIKQLTRAQKLQLISDSALRPVAI
ncbi:GIY-YIG nuclease family protein [Halioxenophilus sp. WMMB6]|uniref:GIY-YIG nuclease family protein n=1 Tax=Halioxenophilus sp. WMMB6 TaxID=3073815 RepID=UPI00295E3865|nr:GIY-YIG nuclease family protein [Halioxenophilus sp. WMMB6]